MISCLVIGLTLLTFTPMKSYFIRLFNYNHFTNKQINNVLLARHTAQAVKLMAHLLSAEQLWLQRCKHISTAGISSWPEGNAETFDTIIDANHREWIAFLNGVTEDAFEKAIHYQNSIGEHFDSTLSDMITQVLNHGTHTRAQIGQILKQNDGDKLPVTDYIYYSRQLNN